MVVEVSIRPQTCGIRQPFDCPRARIRIWLPEPFISEFGPVHEIQ